MVVKIIEAPCGSGKTVWPAVTPSFVDSDNPRDSGLPHNKWRANQREAMQWIAKGKQGSVIALCRTKNLQSVNYGDTYGFDVLFGKSNYWCIHPDAPNGATCADCRQGENMHKCKLFSSCLYVVQKNLCKTSAMVSLNYSYFLVARWPRENPPSALFLDEAHELSKVVTDFAGCTITAKNQADWQLARFPELRATSGGGGLMAKVVNPLPQALSWLQDAKAVMRRHWLRVKRGGGALKEARQCEQLGRKISATIVALEISPNDWFIVSGRLAQTFGGERRPAFIARPLTAKHHFSSYFLSAEQTVMMSATIGSLDAFTQELGIEEYDSLAVPNQYPADTRPIYILDCPSMGSSAGPAEFEKQADVIAQTILDCPPDWSGLIHVTRINESDLLANRLARRGLQDRIWTPSTHMCGSCGKMKRAYQKSPKCCRRFMSRTGTNIQIQEWIERRQKVNNSICIGWVAFGTGYDGLREKICISAKVPFPNWGAPDSYEAAWRAFSMKRLLATTAVRLDQQLGRTRRGRPQDYDINGKCNGMVGIADKAYSQVRKHSSKDTLDSLVKL